MNSYPKGYHERLHFVMRNLSCRFPSIGFCIEEFNKTILDYAYESACNGNDVSNFDARTFCCSTNDRFQISEEIQQAVRDLEELKYIKTFSNKIELENSINQIDNSCTSQFFTISLDGWSLIESQKRQLFKQGFIAIKFSEEAKIISSAIKLGINEAGYVPLMISDKEYNGQIVPEIFFEISRSLFVVMDSTHPNSGAYYEAGYAKGMKIPVIYTCKKDNFDNITNKEDRPHFDIQQENHILWTDEKDLTSRLKKRIEATMVQR
jgi:nucleoside 2-deoxyribosyltransferase